MDPLEEIARAAQEAAARKPSRAMRPPMSPPAPMPAPVAHMPTPPDPRGTERVWTVHDQGRQFGPHTEQEVAMLWAAGTISDAALAWREGSPRWIPIAALIPMPARPSAMPPRAPTLQAMPNKIAAGICALLFPCLGVHKFILGLTGAGAAMLIISIVGAFMCFAPTAVMAIIGFIEGIIYLTKSDEAFYRDYVVHKRAWF